MKTILMLILSAFLTVSCAKRDETGTTQSTDTTVTPESGTTGSGTTGSESTGTTNP